MLKISVKNYHDVPKIGEVFTIWPEGGNAWYLNGMLHRVAGPALETSIVKQWFQYGKLHRADGPAREYFNDQKEWYLNGIEYATEEDWENAKVKDLVI
jgi:hypothetical protein